MEKNVTKLVTTNWCREFLNQVNNGRIVVIIGAGVSVPTGIPDFRSENGIFAKKSGKDVFNDTILTKKEGVIHFYKTMAALKKKCDQAIPTEAHRYFLLI